MKYLSFIHKPELRFHYRFLSVQHQTKKWSFEPSFENLPLGDLVYAPLSRSFRFFSHFWPAVWHLWRFISVLITPTCNLAAKHQLYIDFQRTCTGWYERATSQCVTKLKGKNTCGRLVFVSNRSDAGKPYQTAPAHQLCILEGWYVFNRAPLQGVATKIAVLFKKTRMCQTSRPLRLNGRMLYVTVSRLIAINLQTDPLFSSFLLHGSSSAEEVLGC